MPDRQKDEVTHLFYGIKIVFVGERTRVLISGVYGFKLRSASHLGCFLRCSFDINY